MPVAMSATLIPRSGAASSRSCTYMILDLAPKGRDEDGLGFAMEWVRYHDRYGTDQFADSSKPYWPAKRSSAGCSCESAEGHS
jgi:hypothetical protein